MGPRSAPPWGLEPAAPSEFWRLRTEIAENIEIGSVMLIAGLRPLTLMLLTGLPFLSVTHVTAAEILHTSAVYEAGTLTLHSEILVGVPAHQVRAILTDYENLPSLSRDLKRVKILERFGDGRVRMRADSTVCILTFCRDFAWMQDTQVLSNGDIAVKILPRQGDFSRGKGRWRMLEHNGDTRLIFDIDLTPAFWLPPVFGPWFIKRKLFNEVFETSVGIEQAVAAHRP